jgi:indole-3-glycerol phosphate synthase
MHEPNILARILDHKRDEVERLRASVDVEALAARARSAPRPTDFLSRVRGAGTIRVIAEIKKTSPSAGIIRENFDPAAIARSYERAGAAALSVLTDHRFFLGSLDDLRAARSAVKLPILRKDFLLDPIQVYEAKLAGASACLLIADCLGPSELSEFVRVVEELGMTALVEFYDERCLDAVLDSRAKLIGINNRDLRTFKTDIAHTLALRERIPPELTVVSESGISSREDVIRLERAGIHAILVGETLMRAPDPGRKLAELLGDDGA